MSNPANQDTFASLQAELAANKLKFMGNEPFEVKPGCQMEFQGREFEIVNRFKKIGEFPSYPEGFLEGLRK